MADTKTFYPLDTTLVDGGELRGAQFVDFAGLDYFWSLAKNYVDTADSALADRATALEATVNGTADAEGLVKKVADLRSEVDALGGVEGGIQGMIDASIDVLETKLYGDGTEDNAGDFANLEAALKKYADDAEADAKAYTDDELAAALGAYSTTAEDGAVTPATGIRAEIEAVRDAAKSYSVAAVTGDDLAALGTNVKEAYKLVDEDGAQAGDTIKIYKDSALQSVALEGQELVFTYLLASGAEDVVRVDVSNFLAESEFKNGLQVVDHVVSVKVDAASESFLTVGADGVKLSGVQDAINDAAGDALADAKAYTDALETKLYGDGTEANVGDLATLEAALKKYADDAADAVNTDLAALETKLYGDGTEDNVGDLATLDAALKKYADDAEADAKAYTDTLFAEITFVSKASIDSLFA